MTNCLQPEKDADLIRCSLQNGERLVACLCAGWCSSCRSWWNHFSMLTKDFPTDCFVWIDIDSHPEMMAKFNLDVLPVVLIQNTESVLFLGSIQIRFPRVVNLLLMRNEKSGDFPDPGLRDYLMKYPLQTPNR